MRGSQPPPALNDYQSLLEAFVERRLLASDFESTYLRMFKDDSAFRPTAEYEILNGLFAAVDAYCDDSSIFKPGMLDEDGLRTA